MKSMLVIVRRAPLLDDRFGEALDIALVAAAFGQPVTLLFMEGGIDAVRCDHTGTACVVKHQGAGLDALVALYGIQRVVIDMQDLLQAGYPRSDLMAGVECLTKAEVAACLGGADVVVTV